MPFIRLKPLIPSTIRQSDTTKKRQLVHYWTFEATTFSNHVVEVRSQATKAAGGEGEADVRTGHSASHGGAVCLMFKLPEQQRAN